MGAVNLLQGAARTPIGNLCALQNGRAFKPTEWSETGTPIIRIQNLNDPTRPFNYYSGDLPERFRVRNGDVLLSWSGTPGTSFGCFRWSGVDGWLNQHIFNVRLDQDRVIPDYFVLHVNAILDELIGKAHGGVGLRHITKGQLDRIELSIPSLEKQHCVVDLLTRAENIVRMRREAEQKAKEIIPALFLDMFGDPSAGSSTHEIVELRSVCRKITDGTHKTPSYIASGVPFITVKNITSGILDFANTKYISEAEHAELIRRTKPERGDVLVSKDGTIGVPCPIDTDREFSIFVSVALLKLNAEVVDTDFLVAQLSSPWLQSQIKEGTKGVAIRHLHLTDFRALKLLLPTLSIQRVFAQRVKQATDMMRNQLMATRTAECAFGSLLATVFGGDVTGLHSD